MTRHRRSLMRTRKISQISLRRGFPAAAALVTAAALCGGSAAAAVHPGGQRAAAVMPGTISTVAGGVGGAGQGTKVGPGSACGVSSGTSSVFIADGPVEQISAHTGRLTALTSVGSGGHFS